MNKVNKPKISEILHLAADKYLYDGEDSSSGCVRFSCIAIRKAAWNIVDDTSHNEYYRYCINIEDGLIEMGLPSIEGNQFRNLECYKDGSHLSTKESQAARYFWLKWCALMAEEQGV